MRKMPLTIFVLAMALLPAPLSASGSGAACEKPESITVREKPESITVREKPESITVREKPESITACEKPESIIASEKAAGIIAREKSEGITADVKLDAAAFPDENFRAVIARQADTDGDGMLSREEIDSFTELKITYPHKKGHPCYGETLTYAEDDVYCNGESHVYDGIFMDVSGMEVFRNLETLRFHNIKPENIPFGSLANLRVFSLFSAPAMDVDVSGAPRLEELVLASVDVRRLDTSGLTALKKISICRVSLPGQTLDVSAFPHLEELTVKGTVVGRLNLKKNTALKKLDLQVMNYLEAERYQQLTDEGWHLDGFSLAGNKGLETLKVCGCRLSRLDLSKNKKLKELDVSHNELKELDISNNKSLRTVSAWNNALTGIDLRANPKLASLNISNNSFRKIDSRTCRVSSSCSLSVLEAFLCFNLKTLDVSHIKSLKRLEAEGLYELEQVKIGKNLLQASIGETDSSYAILDEEHFKAPEGARLQTLSCRGLKKADVGHLKELRNLSIAASSLTELDVSGNLKLKKCSLLNNRTKLKKLSASRKSSAAQKKLYREIIKKNGGKLVYK